MSEVLGEGTDRTVLFSIYDKKIHSEHMVAILDILDAVADTGNYKGFILIHNLYPSRMQIYISDISQRRLMGVLLLYRSNQ